MIVSAVSTFHEHVSKSFRVPSRPGRYYRRCPDCGDCCCGWPVQRTLYWAPFGFSVRLEWAPSGSGRDNVVVIVEDDCHD